MLEIVGFKALGGLEVSGFQRLSFRLKVSGMKVYL